MIEVEVTMAALLTPRAIRLAQRARRSAGAAQRDSVAVAHLRYRGYTACALS